NVRESNIIYTMLLQLNVNKNKIIIENTSRDTLENVHNVMKICKNNGWHRIALITSAYHMPRAVKLFHASSLHVEPVPTDSKLDLHYTVYSFMPKFSSLGNSSKAIREYIALMVLYITGN
ncbi:MAG TPA: YdcF family protein, partial [Spirochaetota bacterium]|nr:YdcF family protein [Spirochaetota bacterium]